MSESAEDSLQEASVALRRSVEVLRRRLVDDVAAKSLVAELHETRALMSTMALLLGSFGLSRYADVMREGSTGVLEEADADLDASSRHLKQAADHPTSARQKVAAPPTP